MKKQITVVAIITVALALLLPVLHYGRSDFAVYASTSTSYSLYVSSEAQSTYGSVSSALDQNGTSSYIGPLVETYQFDLQPGNYEFTLDGYCYGTAFFELYSPLYTSSTNNSGKVFASAAISGYGTTTITYSGDSVIRGARLRISYAEGTLSFDSISGNSDGLVYTDGYILAFLILLCGLAVIILLYRGRNKENALCKDNKRLAHLIILAVGALFVSMPIMRFKLLYAHDMYFHLARIEGIYESLLTGQLFPKMNSTFLNGYGYADQIMYPVTLMYFPAVLRLCRVSPVLSYQLFILAINAATAFVSYFAFTKLLKSREKGFIASMAYTLALYRLTCVLVRASVGELLAMIFLPLILLGMYELIYEENPKIRYIIIGFTGVINSHILSLDIACIFCLIFCIAKIKTLVKENRLKKLAIAAGITVLLNLFVLVPMFTIGLGDMNIFSYAAYASYDDAVYPFELFAMFISTPSGGLSETLDKAATGMPLSVGLILGIAAAAFIAQYVFRGERALDRDDGVGKRSLIIGAVALFMATTVFPWEYIAEIPLIGRALTAIQFPWRFLGVASAALAVVYAISACRLTERLKRPAAAIICCAVLFVGVAPCIDYYMQDSDRAAIMNDKFTQLLLTYLGGQEYLYYGTNKDYLTNNRGYNVKVVTEFGTTDSPGGTFTITNYQKRGAYIEFDVTYSASNNTLEFPALYYKGWQFSADVTDASTEQTSIAAATTVKGEDASLSSNKLVQITLPADNYINQAHVTVKYSWPASHIVASVLSVLALGVIILLYILRRANRTPRALTKNSNTRTPSRAANNS